jgi:glycosyltransferase involved in cell wall biosynthesis
MMKGRNKPRILVFSDYYLPGYKSGGGMRTIVNMVDRLHEKYDFWIVTRDHDGTLDLKQYENVLINQWNEVRNAQVFYLSKDAVTMSKLRDLIHQVNPDLYYANSFFATLSIFLVKLRKFGTVPFKNIVIAPCGEVSEGSLKLKPTKKWLFIKWSKTLGLHKNIIWKASSELEKDEINEIKGSGGQTLISPDLPPKMLNENFTQDLKPEKFEGTAKMIFLSRFYPKKNFKWLLEQLPAVKGNLIIDVFGPLENQEYWDECQKLIENLPPNIQVKSKGSIPYEETAKLLIKYHFFVLPTLSENFGHVFLEALAAGCPLVISNRTPWLDLEAKGIGWDLPLEQPETWVKVFDRCISMNNNDYQSISSNSRKYAIDWLADSTVEKQTVDLLEIGLQTRLSIEA